MTNPAYKKIGAFFAAVLLLFGAIGSANAFSPDDLVIWREFVDLLRSGNLTQDRIKPHEYISKETQLLFLDKLKKASSAFFISPGENTLSGQFTGDQINSVRQKIDSCLLNWFSKV